MAGTAAAPDLLAHWMAPFAASFARPTWRNLRVLPAGAVLAGAVLAPGRRTVTAALSVRGLRHRPTFTNFHRVRHRHRWSGLGPARRLLHPLVAGFAPGGPVVIGIDGTPERRWGRRIKARGIYPRRPSASPPRRPAGAG